jgi:uncharacterized membrane protein YgdD (TMEM256/DUF423 family)
MPRAARRLIASAALLLALATLVGAVGSHLLRTRLSVDRFDVFETAVLYQFFHSLGLLAVGVLAVTHGSRLLHVAGAILAAGIVLFCGSLYLLIAAAPRLFGVLTPLGGLCLNAGWLLVAFVALRQRAAAGS